MFQASIQPRSPRSGDLSALLDRLAHASSRPRYAYMLLTLIAEVARSDGSAGPLVAQEGALLTLRDWLCDALTPMGGRDPRRLALTERVRLELKGQGQSPTDAAVEEEVKLRVRVSGKANLSRAVSELVAADLLRRHYQGFRVDHHNRGAQRHAVYTLTGLARALLIRAPAPPLPGRAGQGELGF
ncbi:hypothetical protein [Sphingobium sp. AP50]|uniref:hypothetical protein n=1 Tax=Sphingobium sp. AP50 TaxID=1884369 RepID=UPI000B86EEB6|nr:hypothetical protein [Sphingobium sp. AP50]